MSYTTFMNFPGGSVIKNPPANARDTAQSLGQDDLLEETATELQYSCLENSTDRRPWWAAVHMVTKSRTWLSDPYSWSRRFNLIKMSIPGKEQVGGGVGGCAVHLSPRIHQEYTFRHRSACRIPAESRQEYLTRGKEYIELDKTW